MLEKTGARLPRRVPADGIGTVTSAEQVSALRKHLPAASRKRALVEPVGRNTAAAIALAAFHIRQTDKSDALMAVLPADHYIRDTPAYQTICTPAHNAANEPRRLV